MNKGLEVLKVIGLGAVKFMKIGATQTAIYNLNESNREDIKGISGQIERGYKYTVSPQLQKIKVIKGGRV
jgi:hypothetical protein